MIPGIIAGGMVSGGGPNPYLDGLDTSPIQACSLKKLISTAAHAIRVRRSSDNAEQNIGFSGAALDTTAMLAFVGAGSGYVTTIYDQTGNGYHWSQATASKQPRIVNSGVYDGIAKWDGSDDGMAASAVALSQPQLAVFIDGILPSNAGTLIFLEASTNWNSNAYSFIVYTTTSAYEAGMNSASPGSPNQKVVRFGSLNMNSRKLLSLLYDRAMTGNDEVKAFEGGVASSGSSVTGYAADQSGNFSTRSLYLGGRAASSLFSAPQIFSLVIYNADISSIRSSIEAIIG